MNIVLLRNDFHPQAINKKYKRKNFNVLCISKKINKHIFKYYNFKNNFKDFMQRNNIHRSTHKDVTRARNATLVTSIGK